MSQKNKTPLSYALFLLNRRDYGKNELAVKIAQKYGPEEVTAVIERLEQKNFLDDERFARNFIRLKSGSKSKQFIKNKLFQIKISSDLVERILEEEYSSQKEHENIKELAQRYVRKKEGEENLYQKTGSFLLRRGFSYDLVKKVLSEIL